MRRATERRRRGVQAAKRFSVSPRLRGPSRGEGGFTLVEFIIAAAITTAVLGSAVLLASQLQQAYSTDLEDATVEEEVRFTLDWIARELRNAGSNPYTIVSSNCPAAGTPFQAIRIDPDGDGLNDDIRIQADVNPPNGLLGGSAAPCTEANEDITIAHDAGTRTITRWDRNVDASAVTMTEPVISQLLFTYLDASRNATAVPAAVTYVQVQITGRSQVINTTLGQNRTSTLQTEVRIRTR